MIYGMRLVPLLLCALAAFARQNTVLILDKEGKTIEGPVTVAAIRVAVNGAARKVPLDSILSIHSGEPASASESARIAAGIADIQAYTNEVIPSEPRRKRDRAVEELTAIGLPVLTPLLRALKDTDQHEPRPLYRLFERLIPSEADQLDREASLLRLVTGEFVRGRVEPFSLSLNGQTVDWSAIRRLAVRRKLVDRKIELHSLRHSTQIEYLDTGVILSPASNVTATARGFVRLSWNADGWTSGPDGLKVPAPNYKTHLVDGHPFGAIVARVGSAGEVIFAGARFSRGQLPAGPLQLAVNDNRHWQNNLGTFRVSLQAADAYDTGAAQ